MCWDYLYKIKRWLVLALCIGGVVQFSNAQTQSSRRENFSQVNNFTQAGRSLSGGSGPEVKVTGVGDVRYTTTSSAIIIRPSHLIGDGGEGAGIEINPSNENKRIIVYGLDVVTNNSGGAALNINSNAKNIELRGVSIRANNISFSTAGDCGALVCTPIVRVIDVNATITGKNYFGAE